MNPAPSTASSLGVRKNVYISTKQRDVTKYPSASSFTIDLPGVIKRVHSIGVRSFKYTPEPLINSNNNTLEISYSGTGGQGTSTIVVPKGDYNEDINTLLDALNNLLDSYNVAFTVDMTTQLVSLVFTQPSTTTTFSISYCGILKILGFSTDVQISSGGATAPGTYDVNHDTDLVVRIDGLESIMSVDQTCDRATAILMSNRTPQGLSCYTNESEYPLLQVVHRLQTLRIRLLNSDGDPYDFNSNEATFMFEFYCLPEC